MANRNPPTLLVGMYIGAVTMENSMEVPQKIKNRTTILSRNASPGCLSKGNKITISKKYLHPQVHYNVIYNRQEIEEIYILFSYLKKKRGKSCHL